MNSMLKITGLIVITAASSLAGNYFSHMLKCRLTSLKKVGCMIDDIITMIRFKSPTVYEIADSLISSERFADFDFLRRINRGGGVSFQRSWCKAVEECPPRGMTAEDAELLSDIGRNLGTSDTESQLNTLRLRQTELLSVIAAAEADFAKKGKLYRSMGVLAGAFISIMLI